MVKKIFLIFIGVSLILLTVVIIISSTIQYIKKDNEIDVSNKEIKLEVMKNRNTNKINIDDTSVSEEEISNKIFEEKVLLKECEKRNIDIEDETKQELKKVTFNNPISDENMKVISNMNMTEEEFRNYLYNKLIDMQLRVNLKKELLEEINTNNIKINNQEFKQKVKNFNEYKNSENVNIDETIQNAENLLNEYITILEKQYTKVQK